MRAIPRIACCACLATIIWFAFEQARSVQHTAGEFVLINKPSDEAIVGSWQFDPSGARSVSDRVGKAPLPSTLWFEANGRLVAANFPFANPFKTPRWRVRSGAGRWSVYKQKNWVVSIALEGENNTSLDIREMSGRVASLTYSPGDPDGAEIWIWRRTKPAR